MSANSNNFKIFRSSAGSGKTYTLVKEYITILLKYKDPLIFKKILAITFTNKAANEMKERVLETLKNLSNTSEKPNSLLENYSKSINIPKEQIKYKSNNVFHNILHNYGEFNILTIDKFIHRIIRSFTRELNLAINFDLEIDYNLFINRSIDLLLEEVGDNKDLTQYLVKFSENLVENSEKGNIENELQKFSQILLKEEGKNALEELKNLNLSFFIEIHNKVKLRIKELKKQIEHLSKETVDIIENQGISINDLAGGKNGFGKMYTAFLNNKIDSVNITDTMLNRLENNEWYSKSSKKHIKVAIDCIKPQLVKNTRKLIDIKDKYITELIFNKNFIGFSLLNSIYKVLNTIKNENNIIFINDFNEIISNLIQNEPAPFIYEKIGNRYKYFLIDEFQDTSRLQWNNLVPLLYDSLANGNKNLIVGDAKQAIYRWRGGNVEQFINLPKVEGGFLDLISINKIFKSSAKVNVLKNNYRSCKNIINFNNSIFKNVSENYDNENIKKIYSEVSQNPIKEQEGLVSYKILSGTKDDTEIIKKELTLEYIEECLKDGFRHNDIAILVRNNGEGRLIANYLNENNIPIVSSDSVVLSSSKDVEFLISFLITTTSKSNDQSMLICMWYLSKDEHPSTIHEKWRIPSDKNKNYTKNINFKGYIKKYYPDYDEIYLDGLNLYDKIIYIIEKFNLNRFDPYIDQLLNTAQNYLKKNTSVVKEFIKYFDENKDKIAVNTGSNNNAVQISTIHKSKGLQYPVVIIPFADWIDENKTIAKYKWINTKNVLDYDIPKYIAPLNKETVKYYNLDKINKKEEEEVVLDNLNLFYVAFTRPETRMYIISRVRKYFGNNVYENINNVVLKNNNYDKDKNILLIGNRTKKEQKHRQFQKYTPIPRVKTWRNSLGLSLDKNALELELTELNEREYGNAIHYIWSKIKSPKDVDKVIEKAIIKGELPQKLENKVKKEIKQCINIPEVKKWYNIPNSKVLNESTLVSETGQSYIPDKVILTENKEAIIIDYKTGNESSKHKKQLKEYGQLLSELGYKPKLNILYMKNKKVVVC